jgi:hypothetical protein
MGLLSTLGGIAGNYLLPGIGGVIGAGLGGAIEGRESVGEASQAQQQAAQGGIDEQRRQFDAIQQLLNPYVEAGRGGITGLQPYAQAGEQAFGQQQAFLGLQGPQAQQQAIAGLQSSPQFQAMQQQGENAILQNASATGGLRGGNVQGALAQFRPALLSSLINQQYERLGGLASVGQSTQQNLASLGQNAAAGVGNAGMSTGANISNLLGRQGQAQAGGILGQQSALTGGINKAFGAVQGAGGFGQLFGGGGGSGLQAQFSQTPIGSSGFGSGLAYGNQDLGLNF